jgi:hypothetical protein
VRGGRGKRTRRYRHGAKVGRERRCHNSTSSTSALASVAGHGAGMCSFAWIHVPKCSGSTTEPQSVLKRPTCRTDVRPTHIEDPVPGGSADRPAHRSPATVLVLSNSECGGTCEMGLDVPDIGTMMPRSGPKWIKVGRAGGRISRPRGTTCRRW